jgi:hypothetical protein
MDNADSGLQPIGPTTGWAHPRPTRAAASHPGERATQIDLVRQARAARSPLSGQRPLAETVATGLRQLYGDVLTLPLPAEIARLVEALRGENGGAQRPPRGSAG